MNSPIQLNEPLIAFESTLAIDFLLEIKYYVPPCSLYPLYSERYLVMSPTAQRAAQSASQASFCYGIRLHIIESSLNSAERELLISRIHSPQRLLNQFHLFEA